MRLGLVGADIAHSLSPRLHSAGLAALGVSGTYELVPCADAAAARAAFEGLRSGEFAGLNVTTPFKGEAAAAVGLSSSTSINTLWAKGGVLRGASTDGAGLLLVLRASGVEVAGLRLGVVGAGGAALAVVDALVAAGAKLTSVTARDSATATAAAQRWDGVAEDWAAPRRRAVDLRLHATRIGHGGHKPLPAEQRASLAAIAASAFTDGALQVDLVYADAGPTAWERAAIEAGTAPVLMGAGLRMLVAQAALSLEHWTGQAAPVAAMVAALALPGLMCARCAAGARAGGGPHQL